MRLGAGLRRSPMSADPGSSRALPPLGVPPSATARGSSPARASEFGSYGFANPHVWGSAKLMPTCLIKPKPPIEANCCAAALRKAVSRRDDAGREPNRIDRCPAATPGRDSPSPGAVSCGSDESSHSSVEGWSPPSRFPRHCRCVVSPLRATRTCGHRPRLRDTGPDHRPCLILLQSVTHPSRAPHRNSTVGAATGDLIPGPCTGRGATTPPTPMAATTNTPGSRNTRSSRRPRRPGDDECRSPS